MAVITLQCGAERTQEAVLQAMHISVTLGTTVNSFNDIVQRAQQTAVTAQQQSRVTCEINKLAVRIHTASEEGTATPVPCTTWGRGWRLFLHTLGGLGRGR